ncbi:amidase family protein [Ramlibacter sp.]|uniref:amidase n=1 Tax=Ramlibacter sp. TaxID=1917967 RepID=UPI002636EDC9|nr:amidase family protein [Ramlibacter sp.]MDB5957940.1 putative amidase [Ramlibacter sp.]
MDPTRYAEATASEIAQAVRKRAVSAVAVVRACIARSERLEPRYNTIATPTFEEALRAAARVDAALAEGRDPGPLAGVPVTVKDLIAMGGVRQSFGSRLLADNVAAEDAPSVARLHAAGACIVGKSTTSELGSKAVGDSPLTGITRNPWNPERTAGGSSAGAAAGVAAGLVPMALATDGGGSIRIPASFCGLFGIKARFGRVPVWPASPAPALAHVGPITRSVADAALMLSVIAGPDPRDPASLAAPVPDFAGSLAAGVQGLRLGWCPSFGDEHVDDEVLAATRAAVAWLQAQGAQVIELPPPFARDPAPAWNHFFYGGLAARLAQLAPTEALLDLVNPALRSAVRQCVLAAPEAQALWRQVQGEADAVLARCDALLTPTLPVTALPVGVDVPAGHPGRNAVDWSYFTYPFNLTGHAAATMPIGEDAQGLPIGLQIVAGARGEEAMVLRVAAALERVHPIKLPWLALGSA